MTDTTDLAAAPPAERVSALAPLRIRDFRTLIAIQLVTGVRIPLQFFAQTWYVNAAAPDNQRLLLLGLLATVRGAAFVSWVLFGGALADRFPRRTTLMVAHAAGFAVVLGTALLLYIPGASTGEGLWLAVMIVLFSEFGLMDAQDVPARNAMVANVAPVRMRTTAMTLNWLALPVTMLVTMPASGWMIDRVGFATMHVFAAGAHLVVLWMLRRMELRARPADEAAGGQSMFENVRAGLGYLRTEPAVRWTIFVTWIAIFGGSAAMWILSAAWVRDVLELGAESFGGMALFWGIGALLASGALATRGEYGRKGALVLSAAVLYGLAVLGFSLTRSLVGAALFFALGGVAFQLLTTVSTAVTQQLVPDRLLGRVMGLLMLANGIAQLMGVAVGAGAQAVGLETVYLVLGIAMTAFALLIMAWQRPLRTLD